MSERNTVNEHGPEQNNSTPVKKKGFIGSLDGNILRLLIIVVSIFLVMSLAMPDRFPTMQNYSSMAFQSSEIAILTLAIMLSMLTGGIDLSINATTNLSAILAAFVLTRLSPADASSSQIVIGFIAAIIIAIANGFLCGLLNGFLIAYVGVTPILATLGTMTLYTGFALVITKGTAFFGSPTFQFLGNGELFGIPMPLIIFVVLALLISVLLNKTVFGFRIYMLGTNPKASRFSGINNARVILQTYIICGLLSAIAGIVILGRTNSANADYGTSYVLQAILIAVLGGIDPNGGFGKISGLILAVISLQFLSTGLNMLFVEFPGANFFKEFAWGILMLFVLLVNYYSNKRKMRLLSKNV